VRYFGGYEGILVKIGVGRHNLIEAGFLLVRGELVAIPAAAQD
jgi:hypothetical protein